VQVSFSAVSQDVNDENIGGGEQQSIIAASMLDCSFRGLLRCAAPGAQARGPWVGQ
jgi:hypothetical protein